MLALTIPSLDPAYNLALEETLFQALEPGSPGWFLIWRNGPSIIVGRHQNTVEEINEAFVRERGLNVVRRMTGGGAVYHDEGNVNFSFLTFADKGQAVGFGDFLRPMVAALGDLGLDAEFSSRNDITINGRKVSGSAQRRAGHRMLHHGTMMVDLDMSVLGQALAGNPDKYASKGVASHRARVANLRELLPAAWSREECLKRVIEAMVARCARGEAVLTPELDQAARRLAETRYRSWEWNYGKSPAFTERRRKRFSFGAVDCLFDVRDGVIRECRLYGDFFSLGDIAELEAAFRNVPRDPLALRAALEAVPVEQWFAGGEREALLAFFCEGK